MSFVPLIRKKLFIPMWVRNDGSPRLRYLGEMERSQYEGIEILKDRQFRRLQDIIAHAYSTTAYYASAFREHGIQPGDIRDERDLKRVPILTKKDIQTHSERLRSSTFKKDCLLPFKTGGSTGKSVTVYADYHAMELGVGSSLRAFRWAGWDLGEPIGRVWGNPVLPRTIKAHLRNALLEPQFYLDTMHLDDAAVLRFAEDWKRIKPTLLHGHSHSLYLVSQYCKKLGITDIRPKAIISTSMMLLAPERDSIERTMGCRVTDLYGCEEVGLIGSECEQHQGMHINMENNYVEYLDTQGRDVTPGQEGAIIVTNLNNYAMPILRYRIEDVGVPSDRACACGRGLPIMEKVTGRVADFLVRRDGSLVAGVSLVERTLTAAPGIDQMQLIQEDLSNITLNLVKGESYTEKTAGFLAKEFRSVFGNDIKLHMNYVEAIPQESNGKFRFSISKVGHSIRSS